MKHRFFEPCDAELNAIAQLCRHRDGLMLTNIHVPYQFRERGIGRRLLLQVLAAADECGKTIYLCASSSGAMSDEELVAWYSRYGFEEFNVMVLRRKAKENSSGKESAGP